MIADSESASNSDCKKYKYGCLRNDLWQTEEQTINKDKPKEQNVRIFIIKTYSPNVENFMCGYLMAFIVTS